MSDMVDDEENINFLIPKFFILTSFPYVCYKNLPCSRNIIILVFDYLLSLTFAIHLLVNLTSNWSNRENRHKQADAGGRADAGAGAGASNARDLMPYSLIMACSNCSFLTDCRAGCIDYG